MAGIRAKPAVVRARAPARRCAGVVSCAAGPCGDGILVGDVVGLLAAGAMGGRRGLGLDVTVNAGTWAIPLRTLSSSAKYSADPTDVLIVLGSVPRHSWRRGWGSAAIERRAWMSGELRAAAEGGLTKLLRLEFVDAT